MSMGPFIFVSWAKDLIRSMPENPKKRRNSFDHSTEADASGALSEAGEGIVAVAVENRGREVCICWTSQAQPSSLGVILVAEGHSYNETILSLYEISPVEILLHDSSRNSALSLRIVNEFRDSLKVTYISRQYFDQDSGAELLKKVLVCGVDSDLIAKYTFLGASYCLLKYIESVTASTIAAHSLRLRFQGDSDGYLAVDRRSALNLELVQNAVSGTTKQTLFGVINHTKTSIGARLLRSNILRPLADFDAINARLATIENLLCESEQYTQVVELLATYPNLDKLLGGIALIPAAISSQGAKRGLDTLIYLKASLTTSRSVAEALLGMKRNAQSDRLLSLILSSLWSNELGMLLDDIDSLLVEHVGSSLKKSHQIRHEECFAIKPGVDGLLDVARKTFLQTIEEIHGMADTYCGHMEVDVKVAYSTSRGYYLVIPANSSTSETLPDIFIQAVMNRRSISFTTYEVLCLSDRANESIYQAVSLTYKHIQDLLERVRSKVFNIYAMVDSIALLDMLLSCAEMVTLNPHSFCAPSLKKKGTLLIEKGRHPILGLGHTPSQFVANSTCVVDTQPAQLVFGPNGSGKSVLIKQIGLLVVMAQIGYFVPAVKAVIPIRRRILTRIGNQDELENNMSTFALEMKDAANIVRLANKDSLVIVDELGRGTSNVEGISLACAVLENLVQTRSIVFFVTHFPQLVSMSTLYSTAIKSIHMKVEVQHTPTVSPELSLEAHDSTGGVSTQASIRFLHQVESGPFNWFLQYGLVVAKMCVLPEMVLERASKKREKLYDLHELRVDDQSISSSAIQSPLSQRQALIRILQSKIVNLIRQDVTSKTRRAMLFALRLAVEPNLPTLKQLLA